MRKIASLAVTLLAIASAFADEIQIKHGRPSRILGLLMSAPHNVLIFEGRGDGVNMLPVGLRVKANDAKRILTALGPEDDVAQLKRLVELIDVKPREAKVVVDLEAPLEDYQGRSETTLRNNASWRFEDSVSGIQCKIAYRLNEDATITVFITIGPENLARIATARIKLGQRIEIYYDEAMRQDRRWEDVEKVDTGKGFRLGEASPTSSKATILFNLIDPKPAKP